MEGKKRTKTKLEAQYIYIWQLHSILWLEMRTATSITLNDKGSSKNYHHELLDTIDFDHHSALNRNPLA